MAVQFDSEGQVKLISETFVKPKYEVEAAKQPYYLGPVDLALLSLDQMQKGLLFVNANNPDFQIQSNLVDKLKHSFSLSLVHFYPLAGRFTTQKFPDEHACWIYVDCNKGPGARILHATVDLAVSDILSYTDVHPTVRSFFDLGEKAVNHDGHTRPLLSIQVTELRDGVFIGFTMNHSLADGTSLWHFISSLSEIFLQLGGMQGNIIINNNSGQTDNVSISISSKPVYNPFFPEGYGPMVKLPYLEPEEFVGRFDPGPLRERIFRFSAASVAKIKAEANHLSGSHNISSFQAVCAFLWRCITRARNLQSDQETSCSVVTGFRTKIIPRFSQDHFGSYISAAQGSCKVGDILGHELGWSATLVNKFVMAQDEKANLDFVIGFVKNPRIGQTGSEAAYYKPNSVLIGGSARFDMYGPQFGLGRAVAVLAGYANKDDGKVTANPGLEGGGSIDLEVCLKPEIMNTLEVDEEFMSFVSSA